MSFYLSAILLGLCLSSMGLGIFITMKIFDIPDITTDGSYTLGAAVTAVMITGHWSLWIVLSVAMLAGALAGVCTGLIHTRLKIDALLAGILVMTGLYSVNLLVLGRSNIPLVDVPTVFNQVHVFSNETYNEAIVCVITLAILVGLLAFILRTDFGLAMRATGNNDRMTRALGINSNAMKVTGLAIANALTALSGFLVTQFQGFADINMGIGIVIVGLGSVLIGDALVNWLKLRNIALILLMMLGGSVLFQLVLSIALSIGINPNLLKLVTAIFVLLIVSIPRLKKLRQA